MPKPRALFVLQNAWRKGAKPEEREDGHERFWWWALWRSQSGKRLREMIPDNIDYDVVNASALVGNHSQSVYPVDKALMAMRLGRIRPDVVVLCGKVAAGLAPLVEDYQRPCVIAPHPAWRLLSKEHTARIKGEIELAMRDSFPVTDDLMDAPDGAVVNGFKRVGDSWERVYHE